MPKKKKPLVLGLNTRKCQPRLRMIANGSEVVNTIRAEQTAALIVTGSKLQNTGVERGETRIPVQRSELPRSVKRGKQKEIASNVRANVFIETLDQAALLESRAKTKGAPSGSAPRQAPSMSKLKGKRAQKANLVTAQVRLSELKSILERDDVTYVYLGEPLAMPTPQVSTKEVRAPAFSSRQFGTVAQRKKAEDVLIGIIDVQGFDFTHSDFLDGNGQTRFIRIWDQGGSTRPPPQGNKRYAYGSEINAQAMNDALKESKKHNLPAYELEPQSQMVPGSHGTHVASIAAGNRGVCSQAMLAGVLLSIPQSEIEGRKSFYDSTRVADAVDYLIALAHELEAKRGRRVGLSINISLGTNGHAHDGSSAISRWIDAEMSVPGRCVSVAAGNAGQQLPDFEGDFGFVMGRIHTSGVIPARGLVKDIEWVVVGNGIVDVSENELELWYSPQDRLEVLIRPPGYDTWIGPVAPRQFIENRQLKDGSFLSVYNELYHPSNGANYISIYLSPLLSDKGVVGVPAGTWTVRLHGQEVRDGRFHGWIERDDPRRQGRVGTQETWSFPSFFTETSNVDNSSVSSLACGQRVLSVANLNETAERINSSSSQGPTRDQRNKPDTAAPGTEIVAAKGFTGANDEWIAMSGTSMASPFVAGVAGLMLGIQPKLSAAQIEGIVIRTARPLPGASFQWLDDAGFGRINPEACLEEAELIHTREDKTK